MRNATASVVGRCWPPRLDGRRKCENKYENRVLTVSPFTVIILSYIRYVYRGNLFAAPARRRNVPYARVCGRLSFVSSPSLFFRRFHPPLLFFIWFSSLNAPTRYCTRCMETGPPIVQHGSRTRAGARLRYGKFLCVVTECREIEQIQQHAVS